MKIWYDVSGIYNWAGNFTGIQRVVYSLGKELDASHMDSGFFIYHAGHFSEVSFQAVEERLKALKTRQTSKVAAKRKLNLATLRHHGILALKDMARGTRFESKLRRLYSGLRKHYRAIRGHRVHTSIGNPFGAGDVVIIVDGNWQFSGYAEAITSARAKTRLHLMHFVQDMIAIRNPALANPGADKIIGSYFKKIFSVADSLIAISNSTKNDIEWFIDKSKIAHKPDVFVLNLGDNILSTTQGLHKPSALIPESFILAVSTIEIRKNYPVFYYAYRLALQRGVELPHLVIVGRKGWMAEEAYTLLTEDPAINHSITILRASDAELEWLYRQCMFTVFPSFCEGWGLPIAESLAHGKCCISSSTSSMPEVGGDLVTYVSPYNPLEVVEAINKLSNKRTREKMERRIHNEYTSRTWTQTFSDLQVIINELATS